MAVRLKDRLPYARGSADLDVRLTRMPVELSTDPVYVRLEKPKQILHWDVEVPAGAAGADATLVEYGYEIAFDKQLTLANPLRSRDGSGGGKDSEAMPADESILLREFEAMEKGRRTR